MTMRVLISISFGFSDLRRGQNEAARTLCKTSQCSLITYGYSVASGFVGTRAALTKIALALAVRSSSARLTRPQEPRPAHQR